MVRSANTNPIPSSKTRTQLTARISTNIGEEIPSYRPSFNLLGKTESLKPASEEIEGFLFTKHLNKLEKDKIQ